MLRDLARCDWTTFCRLKTFVLFSMVLGIFLPVGGVFGQVDGASLQARRDGYLRVLIEQTFRRSEWGPSALESQLAQVNEAIRFFVDHNELVDDVVLTVIMRSYGHLDSVEYEHYAPLLDILNRHYDSSPEVREFYANQTSIFSGGYPPRSNLGTEGYFRLLVARPELVIPSTLGRLTDWADALSTRPPALLQVLLQHSANPAVRGRFVESISGSGFIPGEIRDADTRALIEHPEAVTPELAEALLEAFSSRTTYSSASRLRMMRVLVAQLSRHRAVRRHFMDLLIRSAGRWTHLNDVVDFFMGSRQIDAESYRTLQENVTNREADRTAIQRILSSIDTITTEAPNSRLEIELRRRLMAARTLDDEARVLETLSKLTHLSEETVRLVSRSLGERSTNHHLRGLVRTQGVALNDEVRLRAAQILQRHRGVVTNERVRAEILQRIQTAHGRLPAEVAPQSAGGGVYRTAGALSPSVVDVTTQLRTALTALLAPSAVPAAAQQVIPLPAPQVVGEAAATTSPAPQAPATVVEEASPRTGVRIKIDAPPELETTNNRPAGAAGTAAECITAHLEGAAPSRAARRRGE